MKILVSWSSGEDSAWMLHTLRQQQPDAIGGLLTTTNEACDRVAMHAVRRELLQAQGPAALTEGVRQVHDIIRRAVTA